MAMPREKRYTLGDILDGDESRRLELIQGVPMLMAPPSRLHQEIAGELFAQLHAFLKGKPCRAYSAPFGVRLFEAEGDDPAASETMVEPDITVVCDPGKLDDLGCRGAPDLIMEVLSPSTQRHDRLTKLNLYQQAGVREYWIVNPMDRTAQSFLLEDGRYMVRDIGVPGDRMPVTVLKGCAIDLSAVFP